MLIDCDTCTGQGVHCHDCVVTVLLNAPPQRLELDGDEHVALARLADAGLVPPLRLVADLGADGRPRGDTRDTRGIA